MNDGADNALTNPIPEFWLEGYHTINRFNLNFLEYKRLIELNIGSFASSYYSGFLGVGPCSTVNEELDKDQKENLLKNSVLY